MKIRDKYSNFAVVSADIADGSVTFTELQTGISLGQGMGIVIDQIDYYLNKTALQTLDADGDTVHASWTVSNTVSSIDVSQKQVIHQHTTVRIDGGTAANMTVVREPKVYQFFPPIILASPRIYLASQGAGVGAGSVTSRLYFRYIELSSAEYLELAETFVLVG